MAIKVNGRLVGETAKEQLDLEKKRSELRQREKQIQIAAKEIRLRMMSKGSKKLSEFI